MSQLNSNTESLQEILAAVNALPDAGAGGGATTWDDLGTTWGNGTVLAENTPIWVEDSGMFGIYETVHVMAAGYEYTVSWNGAEYACLAEDYYEEDVHMGWMLGNTSVLGGTQENENPFVLVLVAEATDDGLYGFAVPLDGATELTLSVTGYTEIITPVPAKYLGDVRGQRKIEIDLMNGSPYANVPFDLAWEMDVGELQSAMTVIYNDEEYSVMGLRRMTATVDGVEGRVLYISFTSAEPPSSASIDVGGCILVYTVTWRSTNGVEEILWNTGAPCEYMIPVALRPSLDYANPPVLVGGVVTGNPTVTCHKLSDIQQNYLTLRSPSGNTFKVTVDDNGTLTATQV